MPKRSRVIRTLAAVALAAGGITVSTASPASAAPTWSDCPSTYFCAWNDADGKMCKWQDDSRSWYDECSWADEYYPAYVYNHGTSGRGVTIYRNPNFVSPIGACVTKGKQVTLRGNYFIGSHAWNC
ncbi:peptidase inhibitor family I36 protein [Streptomyces sp. NPDC005970]|uniref:peptidase inhibitor family I36 protein n=1 Tax=Streptomyces sp. NPDC005970 TaxID=3156723 RepID=UPI0033D439A6